jgi:multiple sugar transport system substrate-binding protein
MARRLVAPIAMVIMLLAACSTAAGGSEGTPTIHWYTAPQAGGSFADAAKACTDAAHGQYKVSVEPLPADSSQQREQLVRRLAANDSSIDLISMDVIWTAEFAGAGWVEPWPQNVAAQVSRGAIPAVVATGTFRHRMYAAPLNTGSQVLMYRKDLVPKPPTTWAEMLRMAKALPAGKRYIQVQGAKYEGLTVWFNSLLESAGGSILTKDGKVSLATKPTEAAMTVMHDLASSDAADPSLSNNQEDQGRIAYASGNSAFMVNYSSIYAAVKASAPDIAKKTGIAPWPEVVPGQPSRVSLGGFNIGVSSHSTRKAFAFDAARCLAAPPQQKIYVEKDGLPPVSRALYHDPTLAKYLPFSDVLLQTFENGSTRPVSPAYNDISLAVQDTLHPPASINPKSDLAPLRSRVDDAIHSRGLL